MKMFLISDNIDTYTGMRLAGVEGVVVHEREELRRALEDAIANKENALLNLLINNIRMIKAVFDISACKNHFSWIEPPPPSKTVT